MRATSTRILHLVQIAVMLILVAICFFFGGCSSCSTNPKTGSISGHVTLINDTGDAQLDPVDFSGVTVAVYELVQPDSTLVRLNDEYPQAGITMCQEAEFDHRMLNPIKITTSSATGDFQLTSISEGRYNLALISDLWGIRYVYQIEVKAGLDTDVGEIYMYPLTEFDTTVTSDVIYKSGHHYLIKNDVSFVGNVTFEPAALVSINPSCTVRFYGNVSAIANPDVKSKWRFNSSYNIFSTVKSPVDSTHYYTALSFYTPELDLNSGCFFHILNGIGIMSANSNLSDIYVNHSGSGIAFNQGNFSIENSTVANAYNCGVQIMAPPQAPLVNYCVFKGCGDALNIYAEPGYLISNSYFFGNNYGIRPDTSAGTISNNSFDMNNYDVFQFSVWNPVTITFNNFFHSKIWSVFPRRRAIINNNNFFRTDGYYIWIRAVGAPPYSFVLNDIDATNNYWAVSNIDQYIQDANDNGDYPNEPCPHYVIYMPKRSVKVPNAGVQ